MTAPASPARSSVPRLPLVIVHTGEYAQRVAKAFLEQLYPVVGFVETRASCSSATPDFPVTDAFMGLPVCPLAEVETVFLPQQHQVYVAMDDYKASRSRRYFLDMMTLKGYGSASFVHSSAWVAPDVTLGRHVWVGAGAVIQTGAVIGDNGVIQDQGYVGPGSRLAEDVYLHERAFVGAQAVLQSNTVLGRHAMVDPGVQVAAFCRVADRTVVSRSLAYATCLQQDAAPILVRQ